MKLVYLAGAYSDKRGEWFVFENLVGALDVAAKIWAIPGVACICPHGNTAFMGGRVGYEDFLAGDFEIIRRLDGVVMMPDWKESRGALREHALARELGKPVFYWPIDRPALTRWARGEAVPQTYFAGVP